MKMGLKLAGLPALGIAMMFAAASSAGAEPLAPSADVSSAGPGVQLAQTGDDVWFARSRDYQLAPYSPSDAAQAARSEAWAAADAVRAALRDYQQGSDPNARHRAEAAAASAEDAARRAATLAQESGDAQANEHARSAQAAAERARNDLSRLQ